MEEHRRNTHLLVWRLSFLWLLLTGSASLLAAGCGPGPQRAITGSSTPPPAVVDYQPPEIERLGVFVLAGEVRQRLLGVWEWDEDATVALDDRVEADLLAIGAEVDAPTGGTVQPVNAWSVASPDAAQRDSTAAALTRYLDALVAGVMPPPLPDAVQIDLRQTARLLGTPMLLVARAKGRQVTAVDRIAGSIIEGQRRQQRTPAEPLSPSSVVPPPGEDPVTETALGAMLFDVQSMQPVWLEVVGMDRSPRKAGTAAALARASLVHLFTGRRITPASFLLSSGRMVQVFLEDGARGYGRFEGFEGIALRLATDGDTERISLASITTVIDAEVGDHLFPKP